MTKSALFNKISEKNPLDEKIFHTIKPSLHNSKGESFIAFKKTIKPHYCRIWMEIGLVWLALIGCLLLSLYVQHLTGNIWLKVLSVLAGAAVSGFLISSLINFFHEAAHFNIAAGKKTNDLLANSFLGVLQAQGIKHYRIVHWQHHVHHGTIHDTEHSYFNALTFRFVAESLTGIRVLKIILLRNRHVAETGTQKDTAAAKKEGRYMLAAGFLFHTTVILSMVIAKEYWLIVTWLLAFGTFFPFFASLRQLLEHRSDMADRNINYAVTSHGKVNRIFNAGFFANILGSAGFTRHLLHHLEPQISYTNLKEVEMFLTDTSLGPVIQEQKTSYYKVFKKLLGK